MSDHIKHTDLYEDNLFGNAVESANKLLPIIDDLLAKFKALGNETLKYKAILGENSKQVKEYNETNKKLSKLTDEINKLNEQKARLQSQVGKMTTKLKVENQELAMALRQQVKEEQAVEGSMKQLSLQLGRLRTEYRNLSREERENANIGGALKTQINALDKEIKDLDASIGNHQRNVGNYTQSILNAGKGLGELTGLTNINNTVTRIYNSIIEITNVLLRKQAKEEAETAAKEAASTAATEANTAARNKGILAKIKGIFQTNAHTSSTTKNTVATEANTVAQKANTLARLGVVGAIIAAGAALFALGKSMARSQQAKDWLEQQKEFLKALKDTASIDYANFIRGYTKEIQHLKEEHIKLIPLISKLQAEAAEHRRQAQETDVLTERLRLLQEYKKKTEEASNIEFQHTEKQLALERQKLANMNKNDVAAREQKEIVVNLEKELNDNIKQTNRELKEQESNMRRLREEIDQAMKKLGEDAAKQRIELLKDEEKKRLLLNQQNYKVELRQLNEQIEKLGDAEGITEKGREARAALYAKFQQTKLDIIKEFNDKHLAEVRNLNKELNELENKSFDIQIEQTTVDYEKKLLQLEKSDKQELQAIQDKQFEIEKLKEGTDKLSVEKQKEQNEIIKKLQTELYIWQGNHLENVNKNRLKILNDYQRELVRLQTNINNILVKQEIELLDKKLQAQKRATDKGVTENPKAVKENLESLQKEIDIANQQKLQKEKDYFNEAEAQRTIIKNNETLSEEQKALELERILIEYNHKIEMLRQDELQRLEEIEKRKQDISKKSIEATKKEQKELIDAVEQTTQYIADLYSRQSQAKQQAIEKEIQLSEEREDALRDLATKRVEGAKENLAFEQRKQAELEKKKQKEIEKQRKIELGMNALKLYSSYVDRGEGDRSLGKTIAEITKLMAFISTIPAFAEGVIDYAGKGTETSDSNIVRISKGESIINAEATKHNKDLLQAINTGITKEMITGNYANNINKSLMLNDNNMIIALIKEVRQVKEEIRSKPEPQISFDTLGEFINEKIKKNNHILINHYKQGVKGLF